MKNIFIFIPDKLEKRKTGYIQGFYKILDDCEAYYITNCEIFTKLDNINPIGFRGSSHENTLKTNNTFRYCLKTDRIFLANRYEEGYDIIKLVYDYNAFKYSSVLHNDSNSHGKLFTHLIEYLQNYERLDNKNGHQTMVTTIASVFLLVLHLIINVINKCEPMIKCSSTFLHFKDNVVSWKEVMENVKNEKKISIKSGNFILARIIDLVAGIWLFNYLLQYESYITDTVSDITELIIERLKALLLYLMGAPIGLKLNYAFNISLGKFFFYHISLWRIFLYGIQPLFTQYFKILIFPLALGVSFQLAMLSDIISVTTFHVYCIYVYAARLFNLQLRGLISLWRLFIGRKYNPLRERVDSCEYSHHQLFIGTLAFTVLLFLLPTTLLYYTVFTMLRIVKLVMDVILLQLRSILKYLPIYIVIQWICHSHNLSGNLCLEWRDMESTKAHMEAKLIRLSLFASIIKFKPQQHNVKSNLNLTAPLHKIFTGVLL